MKHQNSILWRNPLGCWPTPSAGARPIVPSALPSDPASSLPSDEASALSSDPRVSSDGSCPSDQSVGPAWSVQYGDPARAVQSGRAIVRPSLVRLEGRNVRVDIGLRSRTSASNAIRWNWYGRIWAVGSGWRPLYASSALGGQYKWRTTFFPMRVSRHINFDCSVASFLRQGLNHTIWHAHDVYGHDKRLGLRV